MLILKKIDGFIKKLEELVISYSVIAMAVILIANVFARRVLNNSLTFAEEAGQFMMVILTFMGTSYAVRKGSHINMSAFLDFAPAKIKKVMVLIISFVTMVLMFIFAYLGYEYLLTVIARGRVTPAMEMPRYYITMFLPIGFFLAGVQYLINFILNLIHKNEVYLNNEEPLLKANTDINDVTESA
ncbi:TRAP transporter small permease subunit [Clostridium bovifaecis]|uniref:TRAP transporter small permease subunit n=1 Tax=Clostridium bovifaecis TaxID=2184719 RepID=A0A6I6EUN7_9CLOT|nr:TRAP transporter small permease subunit [Clostridium bovifaecis]